MPVVRRFARHLATTTLIAIALGVVSGAGQVGQTAACDAVADRVRADAGVGAGARTVWSLMTTAPPPLLQVGTISELALERGPAPEVRWLFEKRLRSLYGNAEAVLKDLQTWDDFEILALPGSAVRMLLTTKGSSQCESRYFFRVTTAREVRRVPDPPETGASDAANAICENDGAWGYFGRININGGAEAFIEYRTARSEESLRIVPLRNAEWQPACTVSAQFETTATARGRLRTVHVAASK